MGLVDLLEPGFGRLVPRVDVRMALPGHPPERLLDVLLLGAFRHPEDLVIVFFRIHPRLLHVDFDLLGLGLRLLGELHFQHPVLELRADLVLLHRSRQGEGAVERPVGPLDPVIVLLLYLLLELPLSVQGQDAVLDLHADLVLLQAGKLRFDDDGVLRLANVDRGRPHPLRERLVAPPGPGKGILEELIHFVLDARQIPQGIPPTYDGHGFSSFASVFDVSRLGRPVCGGFQTDQAATLICFGLAASFFGRWTSRTSFRSPRRVRTPSLYSTPIWSFSRPGSSAVTTMSSSVS